MGVENKKNASITIRLECKTKEDLKKLAKKKGITVSEVVNLLITEQLEKENYKNKFKDQLEQRSKNTENKINQLKKKLKWI
ncbi:MAG: hypothetical protein ACRDDY_03135 [Clostridium sp.]|uniref:hypothetical protein n=1 Tax=Clostridium sp. TaxID=1506 RepID=UPI003EE49E18